MPTYSNNSVLSQMSRNSIIPAPSHPRKRAAEDEAPQVSAPHHYCVLEWLMILINMFLGHSRIARYRRSIRW